MQEQIEKDLKVAMLAGDKLKVETLKGIKSACLNEAIAQGAKETGLSDEQMQKVLARESKKRAEAVEMYEKAGAGDRAETEQSEKAIIDSYLPEQMDEAAIEGAIKEEIAKLENPGPQNMGQVIGAVKAKLGASADGATIARLVKTNLDSK